MYNTTADRPSVPLIKGPVDPVIPIAAGSDLFKNYNSSLSAVGIVAVGSMPTPGREAEHEAYLRLRGNVYAHERHFMRVEDLNPDGTETDPDDPRAVHFALFENHAEGARAVGAMRLILKSEEHSEPLPIEGHYPDAFPEPAPLPSVEVSRLISRHESPRVQHSLKWPLFSAGVAWLLRHDIGTCFGAVEDHFEKRLNEDGVPVSTLADGHFVPEFNAVKKPIAIDLRGLTHHLATTRPALLAAMKTISTGFIHAGPEIV